MVRRLVLLTVLVLGLLIPGGRSVAYAGVPVHGGSPTVTVTEGGTPSVGTVQCACAAYIDDDGEVVLIPPVNDILRINGKRYKWDVDLKMYVAMDGSGEAYSFNGDGTGVHYIPVPTGQSGPPTPVPIAWTNP